MSEISIIMGIYNCEKTLDDAIGCILSQTYKNWELIMCDDGSSDSTYEIASKYKNKYPDKIILLQNSKNCGLSSTLNRCLEAASGKYIARMDADDLCSADRLQAELEVFESEPDISIVSCDMEHFDVSGSWGRQSHPDYPVKHDFMNGTPFCHAPSLVRREAYTAVNGYSEEKRFLRVEDYQLWLKMYKAGFRGKNIHRVLYSMRDDRNAYSRRKFVYRINEARVRFSAVKELKLPVCGYIYALRPILVGLLPSKLYGLLHKKKLSKN